jgi:uncharacterized protein (UPF0335 family)
MTITANFVLDAQRIEISLTTERGYIGFTGTAGDGSSGQVCDRIRELYSESTTLSDDIENVVAIWDEWHLKPVNAEDAAQARDLETARTSLENLDGKRFPEEEEGGRAEDFEEASFSNSDDVIDSRDVIKRIEYLNDFLADLPDDVTEETYDPLEDRNGNRNDAIQERIKLRELEDEASNYAPDWRYGETLIRESYWPTYAEEMVKDIGDMPKEIPAYVVIDWEATANNLKVDYTEVDFDGVTYLIR